MAGPNRSSWLMPTMVSTAPSPGPGAVSHTSTPSMVAPLALRLAMARKSS